MWKNIVEPDRPRTTIWRMRLICPTTTNTHSQYVILNDFPLHKLLYERSSFLRYTRTYIVCLVLTETECVHVYALHHFHYHFIVPTGALII
jgi:hypothetical protein